MAQTYYLYVEDDRLSRSVMQMIMEHVMGVSSYTMFEDSENFAERLVALPVRPDIILLDIHVSPLDGFQMLQIIRSRPEYHPCRVIALTASVMNEEVEKLRAAGFDGTLGKPLDALQMPDILRRIEQGESVWHIT